MLLYLLNSCQILLNYLLFFFVPLGLKKFATLLTSIICHSETFFVDFHSGQESQFPAPKCINLSLIDRPESHPGVIKKLAPILIEYIFECFWYFPTKQESLSFRETFCGTNFNSEVSQKFFVLYGHLRFRGDLDVFFL